MAKGPTRIKILNSALDEVSGNIVLRGVVDPRHLNDLQVAPYQREIISGASAKDLMKAISAGQRLPDIELGMRGSRATEKDGVFSLGDDVFIIDGLQRVTAARRLIQQGFEGAIRIGALIHFDTTEAWERARFQVLNAQRSKLSPNVLARNLRHENTAIAVLYAMSTSDDGFALKGRVCWEQRQRRAELVTALTFLKAVGWIHGHVGPGRYTSLPNIAEGLKQIAERVGVQRFKDNVAEFFDLIDSFWNIREVVYRDAAVHLRLTFLLVLAQLFSRHHHVFFTEEGLRLKVPRTYRNKIKQFPLRDPTVSSLAGSGGKSRDMLYRLLVDHVNSGRRSGRLVEPTTTIDLEPED